MILDCDVAMLYGVETRDINKAVKNNPDKFPKDSIFQLNNQEFADLKWKFSTSSSGYSISCNYSIEENLCVAITDCVSATSLVEETKKTRNRKETTKQNI
ncbi:MAG: ORF6N domain-containing protein [Bacteroidaceae bacterium]|nr:ORF6N domain-containing protein [Bacteroidaceae bacterium]